MEKQNTILIVDPDRDFLREWSRALREEGYQVMVTGRITEAIKTIQKEKIDLLILEAEMPEMKGYEAIPIIKGVDPRLPIIMTAIENSTELESKVRKRPIFYYHVKSFGPEELRLAVRNALERQAVGQETLAFAQMNKEDG